MLEQILPEGEEYVSLTNVPSDTTWQDVKDFFRGYNIRYAAATFPVLQLGFQNPNALDFTSRHSR